MAEEETGATMTLTFTMTPRKATEYVCEHCGTRKEQDRPSHGGRLVCTCGGLMEEVGAFYTHAMRAVVNADKEE